VGDDEKGCSLIVTDINESQSARLADAGIHVTDPLIGRVIAERYRIDSRIGSGGMGTVYRATRILIGDVVAIKILAGIHKVDQAAVERFRREALAAARLKHPNVVTIYDFGFTDDGIAYLVMELVEGTSLRTLIRDHGPLEPRAAAEIIEQICAALSEAHCNDVIHRDIKPENVIVHHSEGGIRVKVLDFGIARLQDIPAATLTATGMVLGTPRYMSPEQCMGQDLDGRSDIYSLGILLFEMLAGVAPFNSPTPGSVIVQHVTQQPPPLRVLNSSVSESVEAVVAHALQKRPDDRPHSPMELATELRDAVDGVGRRSPNVKPTAPPVEDGLHSRAGFAPTIPMPKINRGLDTSTASPGPDVSSRSRVPVSSRIWWAAVIVAAAFLSIWGSYAWRSSSSGSKSGVNTTVSRSHRVPIQIVHKPRQVSVRSATLLGSTTAIIPTSTPIAVALTAAPFTPAPHVAPTVARPTISATTTTDSVTLGHSVEVDWTTANTVHVTIGVQGTKRNVPTSGSYTFQPTKVGPGTVELAAIGRNGSEATSAVSYVVDPPAPPTVMTLPPTVNAPFAIPSDELTMALVPGLKSQGYDVLSTPSSVNSVETASQLPQGTRSDYVLQSSVSVTPKQQQAEISTTVGLVGSLLHKSVSPPNLIDVTVACSATTQLIKLQTGQIVGQGSSSTTVVHRAVDPSTYNQTVSDLTHQCLTTTMTAAFSQMAPAH
jgi:serine/threonine protein kinase